MVIYIFPHVYYCSSVWHFCVARDADKLEALNKRIPYSSTGSLRLLGPVSNPYIDIQHSSYVKSQLYFFVWLARSEFPDIVVLQFVFRSFSCLKYVFTPILLLWYLWQLHLSVNLKQFSLFWYGFSNSIPIFFIRLKSDFILIRSLWNLHHWLIWIWIYRLPNSNTLFHLGGGLLYETDGDARRKFWI